MQSLDLEPLPDSRVVVPLTLMSRPSRLLFDTGGATRALTQSTIAALGLHPLRGNISLRNVKGRTTDGAVVVPSLKAGGVEIGKNVQFLVMPGDGAAEKFPFDGVLIYSSSRWFLRRFLALWGIPISAPLLGITFADTFVANQLT